MNQQAARVLFEDGAILVFLDVPEGTEFGIDYTSWNVGSQFKGLKMIPPGVHFVYYSACNQSGQPSPRTGFFHEFTKGEILVRKWDRYNEDVSDATIPEDEYERIVANKQELDKFLGPYPYENYKSWVSLSSHLSADLVRSLEPECGKITVTQFISEMSTTQSRRDKMVTEPTIPTKDLLPDLAVVEGTPIRFTQLGSRGHPEGSTPAEITQHHLDATYVLDSVLTHYSSPLDILGELQFAFICFLIGQVGDAFDQWKKLVHLLCTSHNAVLRNPELYMKFIAVLFYHLKEIPEDFFVDIVSNDNFLVRTLHGLFLSLTDERTDVTLRRRGDQLRRHVTKRFRWDFSQEPEDEAPVVVNLSQLENTE